MALVRLVLTGANFVVIGLDQTVTGASSASAYARATLAAILFFLYAALAWVLIRSRRLPLAHYFAFSSVFDIVFAANLVISTDGYLSPFHLWFVLGVINSGFSRSRRLPLFTAVLALAAHCLIATIPQAQPLEHSVFAVRSGYLFGVAAVLSSINFFVARQSRVLASLADAVHEFAGAMTPEAAARLLLDRVRALVDIDAARLELADGTRYSEGVETNGRARESTWVLETAGQVLGTLTFRRRAPLTEQDEAAARLLCDRAAATLMRIGLSRRLLEAAKAEERLRIADELHDAYLQTLASLSLRAEAAGRLARGCSPEVLAELQAIKRVSEQAGTEIRRVFAMQPARRERPGPDALLKLVAERWPGADVEIAPEVSLSGGQWMAVEAVAREGLNNAYKHAGAQRVSLRVSRSDEGRVVCRLENDGAPPNPQARFGYGLSRLKEIIEQHGGRLSLGPGESGGTLLLAEFGDAQCEPSKS